MNDAHETARAVMRAIDGGSKAAIIDALAAHETAIRAPLQSHLEAYETAVREFFKAYDAKPMKDGTFQELHAAHLEAEARLRELSENN